MKIRLARTIALLIAITGGCIQVIARGQVTTSPTHSDSTMHPAQQSSEGAQPSFGDINRVAPALAHYTQEKLEGEVWNRPGLSKRDRAIVTISALVARGQSGTLKKHVGRALDTGVKPAEISELITHLAFYSGWENALAAIEPTQAVFAERGIGEEQLPPAAVELLPLDKEAESQRAGFVESTYGAVSPGVVEYTAEPLFREVWLRPGLAPRDRSLVTVSALIASGQSEQVTFHLNRAMDHGLTQTEASEVLTQLAFYAGWPRVFSAMPVVKGVFESRSDQN